MTYPIMGHPSKYELKVCRVFDYNATNNTVDVRIVDRFDHLLYKNASRSRVATMHLFGEDNRTSVGTEIYNVQLMITTDEWYYGRLVMSDEERLLDTRPRNINAYRMFLPNFIPQGIWSPVYLYVMVSDGSSPSIGIACYTPNDVPIQDAPDEGTCTPHQHSQRLFPTYKPYLLIPEWDFGTGVTNHYWDLDTESLVCSINASTDNSKISLTTENSALTGWPVERMTWINTGSYSGRQRFFKSNYAYETRATEGGFSPWEFPEITVYLADGTTYFKQYDNFIGVGGGSENYPKGEGTDGHVGLSESGTSEPTGLFSLSFFNPAENQPTVISSAGLHPFYVVGRILHDGQGIIIPDIVWITRGLIKPRGEDQALTDFVEGIVGGAVMDGGKMKWPVQGISLVLKPYGFNGEAFGEPYTLTEAI